MVRFLKITPYIKHLLYRAHCVEVSKGEFVKDLSLLGVMPSDIILLDVHKAKKNIKVTIHELGRTREFCSSAIQLLDCQTFFRRLSRQTSLASDSLFNEAFSFKGRQRRYQKIRRILETALE